MQFLAAPVKVLQQDGRVAGLECIRMELASPMPRAGAARGRCAARSTSSTASS